MGESLPLDAQNLGAVQTTYPYNPNGFLLACLFGAVCVLLSLVACLLPLVVDHIEIEA